MARISRRFDELKSWYALTLPASTDQSRNMAAQDALLLHETLREVSRNLTSGYDPKFRMWLAQSDTAAKGVYDSLRSGSVDTARQHLKALQQSCTRCHKAYRN